MPDPSAGVASGLYWVITGKMPAEDLDEDLKAKPDEDEDDPDRKPKKGNT